MDVDSKKKKYKSPVAISLQQCPEPVLYGWCASEEQKLTCDVAIQLKAATSPVVRLQFAALQVTEKSARQLP